MTVSRRVFLTTGATLLAGFTADAVLPAAQAAASAAPAGPGGAPAAPSDLALYRPVTVSSTDYAPTPAQFAVDRLALVGVQGTGWRAAQGDPQWIAVDLQAQCRDRGGHPRLRGQAGRPALRRELLRDTTGDEILSSAATSFSLDVSVDGKTWQSVYQTTERPGRRGGHHARLARQGPLRADDLHRALEREPGGPQRLPGLRHLPDRQRPAAQGWTDWGAAPAHRAAR